MKKLERTEHSPRLMRPALAALTVGALAFAATALPTQETAQDGAAQVDETRAVLDKWVETRRLIREEERCYNKGVRDGRAYPADGVDETEEQGLRPSSDGAHP